MTPNRKAALERANAARALKKAEREAHAKGLDTTGGPTAPQPGTRPGAPTTSVTPHKPAPAAVKPNKPKAPAKPADPPPPAPAPPADTSPGGARRGLINVLRISAGLD